MGWGERRYARQWPIIIRWDVKAVFKIKYQIFANKQTWCARSCCHRQNSNHTHLKIKEWSSSVCNINKFLKYKSFNPTTSISYQSSSNCSSIILAVDQTNVFHGSWVLHILDDYRSMFHDRRITNLLYHYCSRTYYVFVLVKLMNRLWTNRNFNVEWLHWYCKIN